MTMTRQQRRHSKKKLMKAGRSEIQMTVEVNPAMPGKVRIPIGMIIPSSEKGVFVQATEEKIVKSRMWWRIVAMVFRKWKPKIKIKGVLIRG